MHGIAGALWQVARRLVTARHRLRIAVGFVLAAAVATGAGAVPIEYDYTGGEFTSVSRVYSTGEKVTGSFTFSDALPASSVITALPSGLTAFSLLTGVTTTLSQSLSFSVSDGHNTITNGGASNYAVVLSLDASGQVSNSNINAYQTLGPLSSAHIGQILDAGNPTSNESFGLTSGPVGTAGQGYNFTAGTWSGPTSTPPPSCASVVENAVPKPTLVPGPHKTIVSGPTGIVASFTPNGSLTLHDAAVACGVSDFDWVQILNVPAPVPINALGNPSYPIGYSNDPPPPAYLPIWNSYPFYYDTHSTGSGYSLSFNKTSSPKDCDPLNPASGDSTLCFMDAPSAG